MHRVDDAEGIERVQGPWFMTGRHFLYLRADTTTFGLVFFGRPDTDDLARLLPALRAELAPDVPRHMSLVDTSRVEAVEPASFLALNQYVAENKAALGEKVARLALVRPAGFAGAVIAGFYSLLDRPPYPFKVVTSSEEGQHYIERPGLAALIKPLIEGLDGRPEIVRRLLQLLLAEGFDVETAAAAKSLGLSPRTLQRRLQEAGTSFVDVKVNARVERAKERLLDDSKAINAIADDLGFASAQHFAVVFKAQTGMTPTEWRDDARARRKALDG